MANFIALRKIWAGIACEKTCPNTSPAAVASPPRTRPVRSGCQRSGIDDASCIRGFIGRFDPVAATGLIVLPVKGVVVRGGIGGNAPPRDGAGPEDPAAGVEGRDAVGTGVSMRLALIALAECARFRDNTGSGCPPAPDGPIAGGG